MTLINKIGLLGLLGVVALIIIYVIRPNYQQKTISSTYVWKLSLKKKKKKVPVSTIRNLLLFLCQMLALTCLAMILMKPAIVLKTPAEESETILILDTSASMRTESEDSGETRFERAVAAVKDSFTRTLQGGGVSTVILAGKTPEYLFKRMSGDATLAATRFEDLANKDIGYEVADIDAALKESENVLYDNPDAVIYVYTDANYYSVPDGVNVVNISEESEWNAAILDARADWDEGYYSFTVQAACYGKDARLPINVEIYDVNGIVNETIKFTVLADYNDGTPVTLILRYRKSDENGGNENTQDRQVCYLDNLIPSNRPKIYSFSSVYLEFSESEVIDSYDADNDFYVYGGQKQTLKVQYASAEPNPFVNGALSNLSSDFAGSWDMQITEVKKGEAGATSGFDLYIFERQMPENVPTDGVVFLFDPVSAPSGCGFIRNSEIEYRQTNNRYPSLVGGTEHPIMKNIDPNYIRVSRSQMLARGQDAAYQVLMSLNQLPMLMVRNDIGKEGGRQMLVLSFSFAYSNFGVLPEFYLLMKNAFEYFFPSTVNKYAYEIGEKAELYARGASLSISSYAFEEPIEKTEFPASVVLSAPGTYTITQTTYYGMVVTEKIYVKIPGAESNITGIKNNLYSPEREKNEADYFRDVITYIAAALVAFLFIEWCLHLKDGV